MQHWLVDLPAAVVDQPVRRHSDHNRNSVVVGPHNPLLLPTSNITQSYMYSKLLDLGYRDGVMVMCNGNAL